MACPDKETEAQRHMLANGKANTQTGIEGQSLGLVQLHFYHTHFAHVFTQLMLRKVIAIRKNSKQVHKYNVPQFPCYKKSHLSTGTLLKLNYIRQTKLYKTKHVKELGLSDHACHGVQTQWIVGITVIRVWWNTMSKNIILHPWLPTNYVGRPISLHPWTRLQCQEGEGSLAPKSEHALPLSCKLVKPIAAAASKTWVHAWVPEPTLQYHPRCWEVLETSKVITGSVEHS